MKAASPAPERAAAPRAGDGVGVLLPTYNEAGNVGPLLDRLRTLLPAARLLVVDDDSPDGTAARVLERAAEDPLVELMLRRGARGRGSAGAAGFRRLLERPEIRLVVEMDADFSHDPVHVPALLEALGGADVVIGSRYAPGGSDDERTLFRRLLSRGANLISRLLLGAPVRDATSGFRAFTRRALERIDPASLASNGPSIVAEVLHRAHRAGLALRECPIRFRERASGKSQLTWRVLLRGLLYLLRLRFGKGGR